MSHGVKAEIVALSEITFVKGFRARLLYKAGLRTPADVAAADLDKICNILSAGAPDERLLCSGLCAATTWGFQLVCRQSGLVHVCLRMGIDRCQGHQITCEATDYM